MNSVIEGKPDVVRTAITVLLAEGHLLIEDVPGVGKTMLAKTLARSIDCTVRRIQFTPDLLPSDITGVSVFNQDARDFEFRPGAIFANVVVGDEINRASPKTQSALLESMEERPGHRRRDDLHAAGAVHRHGHPEPHRDGGHLPPARGPARPLHGPHLDGLPRAAAPSSTCSTATGSASPLDDAHARSPTPTTISRWSQAVRGVHTSAADQAVHRRPRQPPRGRRRRCASGASPRADPAPAAGVAGPRRARGPRPRAARRRAGLVRAGARPPDHPHGRDPAGPPHAPPRCCTTSAAGAGAAPPPAEAGAAPCAGCARPAHDPRAGRSSPPGSPRRCAGIGLGFRRPHPLRRAARRAAAAHRRCSMRTRTTCGSRSSAQPPRADPGRTRTPHRDARLRERWPPRPPDAPGRGAARLRPR